MTLQSEAALSGSLKFITVRSSVEKLVLNDTQYSVMSASRDLDRSSNPAGEHRASAHPPGFGDAGILLQAAFFTFFLTISFEVPSPSRSDP